MSAERPGGTVVSTEPLVNDIGPAAAGTQGAPTAQPPAAEGRRGLSSTTVRAMSITLGVVGVAVWQFVVVAFDVSPYILPAPSDVAVRLWQGFVPGPSSFYDDLWATMVALLISFVIVVVVGTALGMVLAQSEMLERVVYPYIFALQAIPKIAVAPLIILWAGFGIKAMIIVAAIITIFPMLVNSMAGFKSVTTENAQMFAGLCATPWQTFVKLKLPTALPMLFAGFELCLIYSLMGVILGEFVGGQEGLGVRILSFNANLDITGEFAVLVLLSLLSLVLHAGLTVVRRRLLFWTPSEIARRPR